MHQWHIFTVIMVLEYRMGTCVPGFPSAPTGPGGPGKPCNKHHQHWHYQHSTQEIDINWGGKDFHYSQLFVYGHLQEVQACQCDPSALFVPENVSRLY